MDPICISIWLSFMIGASLSGNRSNPELKKLKRKLICTLKQSTQNCILMLIIFMT